MITDFTVSYKGYDTKILNNHSGCWDYACPNEACGAKGRFIRHGLYTRYLIAIEGGDFFANEMKILRLRCVSCKTTHAILPLEAIPFWQYSINAVLRILLIAFGGKQHKPVRTAETLSLSPQLIYHFLKVFIKYLASLIMLMRRLSVWTMSDAPDVSILLDLLFLRPPPYPQAEFYISEMTPLFLSRRNTVSYHFFVGGFYATASPPT